MQTIPSPKQEMMRGLTDSIPVVIGLLPWALILGVQAGQKGMSLLEVPMMTGLNFAGGSEFAAVSLWTKPLPVLLIIAVTLMINSRHILMGAAFAPYLRDVPLRQMVPALFLMTDESWAMSIADCQKRQAQGLPAFSLAYYMGVSITLYVVWVMCTTMGAAIGPVLGDVSKWGFGMAFPAVFLVLMRGMYRHFRQARPWLVSLVVAATVALTTQGAWYVPAGTLAGLLSAYLLEGEK